MILKPNVNDVATTKWTCMLIVDNNDALRQNRDECRKRNQRVALIPTMGNLHKGHLELIEKAKTKADVIFVSIFVNPLQFGQNDDYGKYPRTLGTDSLALCNVKLDYLYAPTVDQIYPHLSHTSEKSQTKVYVPNLSDQLCGEFRPGHFEGVTTVVAKLFNLVQPDVVLFGEKDFQQLVVIKQMIRDLNYPIELVSVPTVRELDGLAMSSRNQYLSDAERKMAPMLYKVLRRTRVRILQRSFDYFSLEKLAMKELAEYGFNPEYVSIRYADDLHEAEPSSKHSADKEVRNLIVLVAANLGKARLIDNISV